MQTIFQRRMAALFAGVAGLVSTLPTPASESQPAMAQADAATRGELVLRPNPDAMKRWGVALHGGLVQGDFQHFTVAPRASLDVQLGDGGPTRVDNTPIALPGLTLKRADGETSPPLSLQSEASGVQQWRIVDGAGRIWLRISQAMRSPDGRRELRLFTADLRAGPALAQWLDAAHIDGQLFANAELRLPLRLRDPGAIAKQAKSCAVPNWPGTPGFITDVILTNIDFVDVMRCRSAASPGMFCDGPGGGEGEVVIVPSVTLRNSSAANASEVPWYTKFTGNFPPYDNDQHPYLVWNLYRFDADGRIEQVARSGLKHAFATANDFCVEPCANAHILGRGCEDLYNSFSNDSNFFLSPRREIIPSSGVWGRCGSVFDDGLDALGGGTPGCDGVQDPPPNNDNYRERLVVRETDIEPAGNVGASYVIDSWYVVRDDQDLFNTMGYRQIVPRWFAGQWDVSADQGPFVGGSVLDRWLDLAPAGVLRERIDVDTAEGRVVVATRVTRLPDSRYRYDYAVFNYDLTRPVTSAAEPDLRLERNFGVSAATLSLLRDAVVDVHEFRDGDDTSGNDWTPVVTPASIAWTAPGETAYLEWGQLVSLRVISPHGPGRGELRFAMAEAGAPASYVASVPVPDDALLFSDGFD